MINTQINQQRIETKSNVTVNGLIIDKLGNQLNGYIVKEKIVISLDLGWLVPLLHVSLHWNEMRLTWTTCILWTKTRTTIVRWIQFTFSTCKLVWSLQPRPCGGTLSVRVSRDVPPYRPPFFTSGTPSGWVFKCQNYSCWVSFFRFNPLPLGYISEIFIFNHFWVVIFVKIWYSGG